MPSPNNLSFCGSWLMTNTDRVRYPTNMCMCKVKLLIHTSLHTFLDMLFLMDINQYKTTYQTTNDKVSCPIPS